jgi:hypothetical protein
MSTNSKKKLFFVVTNMKALACGISTGVEHSPQHPKAGGLSPATTAGPKEENGKNRNKRSVVVHNARVILYNGKLQILT